MSGVARRLGDLDRYPASLIRYDTSADVVDTGSSSFVVRRRTMLLVHAAMLERDRLGSQLNDIACDVGYVAFNTGQTRSMRHRIAISETGQRYI